MTNTQTGNQTPTFQANIKRFTQTDGKSAADLSAAYFNDPLPWQRFILDVLLARDENDLYIHRSFAASIPRQNGKSCIVLARCLYGLITEGENILYTCQQGDTADDMFERIATVFESEENEEVKSELGVVVRRANGSQRITLGATGGKIQFKTRTNTLVRGRSYDVVIYDEAQDLTDEQFAASRFTTAASKTHNVQIIYLGTPPAPSSAGTVFRALHDRVHANESGTAWVEWSTKYVGNPQDKARWFETNPSLGYLIEPDTVENEADDAIPEIFARERLGWWSELQGQARPISKELWDKNTIDEIGDEYSARAALGIKFSIDGTHYALVGCKLDENGAAAIELIEIENMALGMTSLALRLLENANKFSCVLIDGQAGSPILADKLKGAPRGYVMIARTGQVIAAAGLVLDGLRSETLKHTKIGQEQLTDSALGSCRRDIGKTGGWGFGSTEEIDSTAIEAAALAYFAAKNSKRNPNRKQRLL